MEMLLSTFCTLTPFPAVALAELTQVVSALGRAFELRGTKGVTPRPQVDVLDIGRKTMKPIFDFIAQDIAAYLKTL